MSDIWLIRTSENKIFGPVSSKKILELISRGSLKKNDEISAGNGFWIFVKESSLIEIYLKKNKTQPFNLITEAGYVSVSSYEMDFIEQASVAKFPEEKDLEYPSKGAGSMMVKNKSNSSSHEEASVQEDTSMPSDDDLEYPDMKPEVNREAKKYNLPSDQSTNSDNGHVEDEMRDIVFDMDDDSVPNPEPKKTAQKKETDPDNVFPDNDDLEYPD